MGLAAFKLWAFSWGLSYYTRREDAFPNDYVRKLAPAILDSPYLVECEGGRGFSVVFRREGLLHVTDEFPEFARFLETVIDEDCNAFLLKVMVEERPHQTDAPRARVERGIRPLITPTEPPNPRSVTVLHVHEPHDLAGGHLRLFHRGLPVGRIEPQPNLLLQFQGWLRQTSLPARFGGDGEPRIRLTCESYVLAREAVLKVPAFDVRPPDLQPSAVVRPLTTNQLMAVAGGQGWQ